MKASSARFSVLLVLQVLQPLRYRGRTARCDLQHRPQPLVLQVLQPDRLAAATPCNTARNTRCCSQIRAGFSMEKAPCNTRNTCNTARRHKPHATRRSRSCQGVEPS
jgi:hypothetical protein